MQFNFTRVNFILVMLSGFLCLGTSTLTAAPFQHVRAAADTIPPSSPDSEGGSSPMRVEKPSDIFRDTFASSFQTYQTGDIKVTIAPHTSNGLYLGIDNPVKVLIEGCDPKECLVRIKSNGKIRKTEGRYAARVDSEGLAVIEVFRIVGMESTKIGSFPYYVSKLPQPTVKFAGLKSGSIERKVLLQNKQLELFLPGFTENPGCTVESFTLTMVDKDGNQQNWRLKGGTIPPDTLEVLKNKAETGTTLFFDDIKTMCPGHDAPTLQKGIVLTVK